MLQLTLKNVKLLRQAKETTVEEPGPKRRFYERKNFCSCDNHFHENCFTFQWPYFTRCLHWELSKRLPSFWILKLVLPKKTDPVRKMQCVHDINIYKLLMTFMGTD